MLLLRMAVESRQNFPNVHFNVQPKACCRCDIKDKAFHWLHRRFFFNIRVIFLIFDIGSHMYLALSSPKLTM